MAVLRNGVPLVEDEYEDEPNRKLAMEQYRQKMGWGMQPDTSQTGGHRRCDTPRHWKHKQNIRV
ncbi:MAG TPA: hypothetical protein VN665_01295 [Candidatus Paceibacterota bacterium]|nr:hypothetical protein [Candidatus Paceibacterota bacterium]